MDIFKLSIRALENRWADLLLVLNEYDIMLYFERVPNDPFYNLLESTMRITDNRNSVIAFHNGSQQKYLSVKKLESNLCRIEFECIHLELPIKQYYKTILRMFDAYTFDFSKDEYNNNWGVFPEIELENLRISYHAL